MFLQFLSKLSMSLPLSKKLLRQIVRNIHGIKFVFQTNRKLICDILFRNDESF